MQILADLLTIFEGCAQLCLRWHIVFDVLLALRNIKHQHLHHRPLAHRCRKSLSLRHQPATRQSSHRLIQRRNRLLVIDINVRMRSLHDIVEFRSNPVEHRVPTSPFGDPSH